MDFIWIIVGIVIVIWALSSLMSPPQKHKDYSLSDQKEAMCRALGGSPPPDIEDITSSELKEKKKQH